MEVKNFLEAFKEEKISFWDIGKDTEEKGRRYCIFYKKGNYEIHDILEEKVVFNGNNEQEMLELKLEDGKTVKDYIEELEEGFEIKLL